MTFLCVWAGIMAIRTHRRISFDALCLFIVAIYNLIFMALEYLKCVPIGEIMNLMLSTCLILLTFYNFQIGIRSLQR